MSLLLSDSITLDVDYSTGPRKGPFNIEFHGATFSDCADSYKKWIDSEEVTPTIIRAHVVDNSNGGHSVLRIFKSDEELALAINTGKLE